jgi:exodeoxyribonuclease V alpha subunit
LVIQKNDYGTDLFNGDDGVVAGEKAFFKNGEGMREIAKARLPVYADAYALSIHRSQGSEYDRVMIILPPPEAKLLSRELLYVAVSRAKKGVVFVGDPSSLVSAVNHKLEMQSGIVELMK